MVPAMHKNGDYANDDDDVIVSTECRKGDVKTY